MADAKRRLAAILAADVAGYSRLMASDEDGTVAELDACRSIFRGHIKSHGGRVVDTAGDSVLATFDSAVETVRCAMAVQSDIAERNTDRAEDQRMRFRIGVNLGDVIERDDGTIYGDGVNIAARLEGLADPGGIVVSALVEEAVKGRVDATFNDLGDQQLRNIARPVRGYAVNGDAAVAAPSVASAIWTQPGIVVLPFVNIGRDPDQEYFGDGLTEDIITALAACRSFPVIGRHSAFAFKDVNPDPRQLAKDLDVGYAVEGSIRHARERVRVNAQLTDCGTAKPVWAQRYDRNLEDIFDLQDELTETIVAALEPALGKAERQKAATNRPGNLTAWELYQRGLAALYRRTRESHVEAKSLLRRAIEAAPEFTAAYAALVDAYFYDVAMGLDDDVETARNEALVCARKAVEVDPHDPAALCSLGKAHIVRREQQEAIPELEAALALNPSLAWAHYGLGAAHSFGGRPAEAIPHLEKAIRLSPYDTHIGSFLVRLSDAHLFQGNFEEAAAWARKAIRQPNFQWSRHTNLLVALGHLGRLDEVPSILEEIRQHFPDFSIAFVRKHHLISDPTCMETYVEGLRKCGVDA